MEASFCVRIRQKFDPVKKINPFHSRVLHERFHLISMSIFHLKLSPKTCFVLPPLANNAPTEWKFNDSPFNSSFTFARDVEEKRKNFLEDVKLNNWENVAENFSMMLTEQFVSRLLCNKNGKSKVQNSSKAFSQRVTSCRQENFPKFTLFKWYRHSLTAPLERLPNNYTSKTFLHEKVETSSCVSGFPSENVARERRCPTMSPYRTFHNKLLRI